MAAEQLDAEPTMTVRHSRFVQDILPFLTSITFHASILLVGAVFFVGVKYVSRQQVRQEQVTVPLSAIIDQGMGGFRNVGLDNDPWRPPHQDSIKDAVNPEGWASKQSANRVMQMAGGGSGESDNSLIALGPSGGFGHGTSHSGSGRGSRNGSGDGDDSGLLASYGAPGGGQYGAKGLMFGPPGGARKIVFVCDASGSMLNKFGTLRRELQTTVDKLRLSQSFEVVFFQEQKAACLNDGVLLSATPENRLKAARFIEGVVPRGETEPLSGIDKAFRAKPELIYLLTDGDFPDNDAVLRRIRQLDPDHRVQINTIAFVSEADTDTAFLAVLKTIAQENRGIFKLVKESDVE